MISISYLTPLCEACNISSNLELDMVNLCWIFSKAVNHITSEWECLEWWECHEMVPEKEESQFMVLLWFLLKWYQNYHNSKILAVIRKHLDSTTMAFAECQCKFRGLNWLIHPTSRRTIWCYAKHQLDLLSQLT